MTTDHWVEAAMKNDAMVAELLLRMKRSSSPDSVNAPPSLPTAETAITQPLLPLVWGYRKNRSKFTASTAAVTNGFGKEHRGSPTTHLSWSGGGGSASEGYDESSRPLDLSSGGKSVKANEGASTSSYNKFQKRKIDLDQNQRNKISCRVESGTEGPQRHTGFVLPDLNMPANEEDVL